MKIEHLLKKITRLQMESADGWAMAAETAGPDYQGGSEENEEQIEALASECFDAYEVALNALEEGDLEAAIEALEDARSLEAEGGDASAAIEALEALEAYKSGGCHVGCDCGRWSGEPCNWSGPKAETVVVEFMPEEFRATHAAAATPTDAHLLVPTC